MRIPDPALVPAQDIANSLRLAAEKIIREDGDRDHMNTSRLTCDQTVTMAKYMLIAAAKLEGGKSR